MTATRVRTPIRKSVRSRPPSRGSGSRPPLLVDEHDVIVAGHGRLAAAMRLGMDEVPCIRVTGLSDAERAALVLADNRIALNIGWDDKSSHRSSSPSRRASTPASSTWTSVTSGSVTGEVWDGVLLDNPLGTVVPPSPLPAVADTVENPPGVRSHTCRHVTGRGRRAGMIAPSTPPSPPDRGKDQTEDRGSTDCRAACDRDRDTAGVLRVERPGPDPDPDPDGVRRWRRSRRSSGG